MPRALADSSVYGHTSARRAWFTGRLASDENGRPLLGVQIISTLGPPAEARRCRSSVGPLLSFRGPPGRQQRCSPSSRTCEISPVSDTWPGAAGSPVARAAPGAIAGRAAVAPATCPDGPVYLPPDHQADQD